MNNLNQGLDYEVLFRMSPDARLLIDNNRIIDINIAALRLFGYDSEDELLGKEIYSLSPALQWDGQHSNDKGKQMINDVKLNEVKRFEWIHQRKTTERFIVEVTLVLIPMENKNVIHASLKDISDRKKGEIELIESEIIHRSMFDESPAKLIIIDPIEGSIINANPAACRFYGYSKSEFTLLRLWDIDLSDHEVDMKNIKGFQNKLKNKTHMKHRLSNGEVRDVQINSNTIELNNKEYLYIIIHDITDKIQAIHHLDESRRKYKMLFNNINDAIFVHSIYEDGSHGKFLEVNNSACRKLEYSREELLKMSPKDINTTNQIKKSPTIARKLLKDGYVTFETIHISKSGKRIPVEISTLQFSVNEGKVVLSIARDVTERKMIEEEIKKSHETYKRLMEFFPSAVFIVEKNQFIYSNSSGLKMLGFKSLKDLIGKSYFDFVPPNIKKSAQERLKKLLTKDPYDSPVEGKLISKDGTIVNADISATRMPYRKNRNRIIIVARDITEKRRAEKQLLKTMEYERLRTEFFSNISHELRTPLNVVLGTLQLLELNINQKKYDDGMRKYLVMMKQNCFRLLRIITNIIDITKIDSGYFNIQLGNYDIVRMVKNITLSVFEYIKQNNIYLKFEAEIEERVIACDCDALERIILNLLSNAMKFTQPGGSIAVNIFDRNGKVTITVADTGIGIPKEKLGIIFDRFRQIDKSLTRNHEGSGIGLALVKHLVEAQGGTISVESVYGKGSKFIIQLPNIQIDNCEGNGNGNDLRNMENYNVERISVEFSDIYLSQ